MSLFISELVLKSDPKSATGYYTCSLIYTYTTSYSMSSTTTTSIAKNQSIIFRPNIKPTYAQYTDQVVSKSQGDMWTDSCSAQGWPLPALSWLLNGRPVVNHTQSSAADQSALPYTISHHRNFTVTAYVIAQNLTVAAAAGRYTCWLNGAVPIKNVTLFIKGPASPQTDTDDSSSKSEGWTTTTRKNLYNQLSLSVISSHSSFGQDRHFRHFQDQCSKVKLQKQIYPRDSRDYYSSFRHWSCIPIRLLVSHCHPQDYLFSLWNLT